MSDLTEDLPTKEELERAAGIEQRMLDFRKLGDKVRDYVALKAEIDEMVLRASWLERDILKMTDEEAGGLDVTWPLAVGTTLIDCKLGKLVISTFTQV